MRSFVHPLFAYPGLKYPGLIEASMGDLCAEGDCRTTIRG